MVDSSGRVHRHHLVARDAWQKRLRGIRLGLGLNQRELAEVAGFDQSWLSRLETGQLRIKPWQFDTLMEAVENLVQSRLSVDKEQDRVRVALREVRVLYDEERHCVRDSAAPVQEEIVIQRSAALDLLGLNERRVDRVEKWLQLTCELLGIKELPSLAEKLGDAETYEMATAVSLASDDYLRELWANLLANSIEDGDADRLIIRILGTLSPSAAKALSRISSSGAISIAYSCAVERFGRTPVEELMYTDLLLPLTKRANEESVLEEPKELGLTPLAVLLVSRVHR